MADVIQVFPISRSKGWIAYGVREICRRGKRNSDQFWRDLIARLRKDMKSAQITPEKADRELAAYGEAVFAEIYWLAGQSGDPNKGDAA